MLQFKVVVQVVFDGNVVGVERVFNCVGIVVVRGVKNYIKVVNFILFVDSIVEVCVCCGCKGVKVEFVWCVVGEFLGIILVKFFYDIGKYFVLIIYVVRDKDVDF